MNKTKKIVALLLATVMMCGMTVTVFADESRVVTGSISISNPATDATYQIYQMFTLESYDATAGAYVYKVTDKWRDFVESDPVGSTHFELYDSDFEADNDTSDDYYVRAKEGATTAAADIAEAAIAYAEADDSITPIATLPITNSDDTKSYTVSGLDLGYYAVDSSAGALCNLTTVAPNSSLTEKNATPTIDKQVLVDTNHDGNVDDGEEWAEKNDANIGDIIQYKTTVHAKKGAHDYVVHDRMGVGLTLNEDSIKVMVGEQELRKDTDYTVSFEVEDENDPNVKCDFEIKFAQDWLDDKITTDTDIVITYSAILNEQALIYSEANKNATRLEYGEELFTEFDITDTFTFMFDVIKTDESNKLIVGAQFKLYFDLACEKEVILLDNGNATYHVATEKQSTAENFVAATISIDAKSKVVIKGLANGTYYLKETKAPTGYNLLTTPVPVIINNANLKGEIETDLTYNPELDTNNAIHVQNKSGSLLPETGGIGTTIFYTIGGILVVAAVVVLVTRKRMSVAE